MKTINEFIDRTNNPTTVYTLCGIICFLYIAYAIVAGNTSTIAIQRVLIEEQVDDVKKQNALLHEKILEASSLRVINARARAMGFTESRYMYLP